MRLDPFVKAMLLLITVFTGLIALRPFVEPRAARAQDEEPLPVYIEPGTTTLLAPGGRSEQIGKVVVDLRNGNIWGFPTLTQRPYPIDATKSEPAVSRPMYLGRYDFAAMNRQGAR